MTHRIRQTAILFVVVLSFTSSVLLADETPDGKKSLGGNGEMIQFDLPDSNRTLEGIQIHGSRYGTSTPPDEKFMIYLMDKDRTKVVATRMAPYSLFERGDETWVSVKFDEPAELPTNGWVIVDFRAGRTKGVYVSFDSDTDGSRSMVGLPGTKASKPDFKGDWLIRPIPAR